HAHLFSPAYIQGLQRIFGNDSSPTGQETQHMIRWMSSDPRMTDVEGRLEEMNKWGIDMQILSVPFHGALVRDRAAAGERASWPMTWSFRRPETIQADSGCSWRCPSNSLTWQWRSWTASPPGRRWWASSW